MVIKFGPLAGTPGTDPWASLGQDDYLDHLGPMLQSDGVNTQTIGGSALQVYGNATGMVVFVRAGDALSRGVMFSSSADISVTIAASTSSPRIDRIVMRLDRSAKTFGPVRIAGTPGASPVAPAITQTVGGVWDFPLAQVTVPASAATILAANVADERQYLPMRVPYCNTQYATPPADGSQGRFFYDLNPSVLGFILTNGSTWGKVQAGDTGWGPAAAGLTAGWFTVGYGPTIRKVGNLVMLRGDVTPDSTSTEILMTVDPAYRPAYPLSFPCSTTNYYVPNATCTVNPDGTVILDPGQDLTLGLNLPLVGITAVRFIFNVTYLAG